MIRPAIGDDSEAIAAIWHCGWSDGHLGHVPDELRTHRRLAYFRDRVPERVQDTTVATIDGEVVGFVMVHEDEVEQMYVVAAARGGGIADTLLRHAENTISERFDLAWLAVVAGNARARRFYARNGWINRGVFDYTAHVAGGTFIVPCLRYEKRVH